MQLIKDNNLLANSPIIATIGFFDGVHIGHRYLIDQMKRVALKKGMPSVIITFPVHPRKVMQQDFQPALLCGYDEKLIRLSTTGVDYCLPIDFTQEMSKMTAREFMHKILKEKYCVDTLIIGYDHRFGYNREDGFNEYRKYGQEVEMDVILADELPGEHVSSSHIRQLLHEGDVRKAAELLSYNYLISGKIIEGFQVGRTIGFPTANVESWEKYKVIPAFGVYAVHVYLEGEKHDGMLYVGRRPTLQNGKNVSVEVNVFSFNDDLYNKSLTAEFLEFIRPDEKFSDLETLKDHILQDKDNVLETLKKYR